MAHGDGVIALHLQGRAASARMADLVAFLREAFRYERPRGIQVRVLWDMADPGPVR